MVLVPFIACRQFLLLLFASHQPSKIHPSAPLSGMALAVVLCHADTLPMPFKYSPDTERFREVCPLGPWVLIFGSFGTVLGLLLSPYCPRCKPNDMCFIDAACVHQTDPNLMKRGIHGIGGFLLVSKELRIIWSPVYLTRLWCAPCPNFRIISVWKETFAQS